MRRFLLVALFVLLVANAAAVGAWVYRGDLQAAGLLPVAHLPARADVAAAPLPVLDADAPDETPNAPAEQPRTELLACALVGTFKTRALAVEASKRLDAQSREARVVAESVAGDVDHLVFVAPATDRAGADNLVRELDAQGVKAYVIPSGQRANGVSVGVFGSEERAKTQQDRVAKLGHDVRLATIDRERLVYRVRAHDVPPAALADMPHEPCAVDASDNTPVARSPQAQ